MLVLSRKIGERIVVPNCELVITLLAIEDQTVRLDISAPADVEEHPEEFLLDTSDGSSFNKT